MGIVHFEDVEVGHPYWGTEIVADEQEMLDYGQRFDPWPMHADPEVGAASPLGGLVASGGYTISLWYLSAHGFMAAPGSEWAFLGGLEWSVRFPRPLRPGDRVRTRLVVSDKQAVRDSLEAMEVAILPGRFLDFYDPWGNRVEIVGYGNIQFTKAKHVLRGMGLEDLEKTETAIEELTTKGMAPA